MENDKRLEKIYNLTHKYDFIVK